jgi:hypothetical protein
MANSDWDLDYRDGYEGEQYVHQLLNIQTVEVKTQREWVRTGNVFVEFMQQKQSDPAVSFSGILVSKATHYAFVLEDLVLIVPTDKLFAYCMEYDRVVTNKSSDTPGFGFLVNTAHLLQWFRRVK